MMTGLLDFFHEAFTMPTAVFSVLLVLVILYWLLAIFGGFHLDSLEGVSEAADSLADGALEGVADGALDGVADGALEGAAEGADLEGVHHGWFETLGMAETPKSLLLSFFVFFAWLFSFLGMKYVPQLVSTAVHGALLALFLSGAAVVLGAGAAIALMIPVARFFAAAPPTTSRDLVGKICTVRTLRVTPTFGQGVIEDDQGSYLVSVRADEPNTLARGSRALVFDYDPEREVFLVSSLPFEEHAS